MLHCVRHACARLDLVLMLLERQEFTALCICPMQAELLQELLGAQQYGEAAAFIDTYLRAWRRAANRDDA